MAETATQQPKYVRMLESDFNRYKSLMKQMEAQGERNAQNVGVPGFLYKSKEDREQKTELARHVHKFVMASLKRDPGLVQKVMDEFPEWYVEKAAFSGAADGEGGFTLPSIWSDQIFSNVDRYGFARRISNVFPMSARTEKFHVGGAVTTAWVAENTAPTAFDATSFFTQATLTSNTMAAAAFISKDFQEDTAVAILEWLTKQYAKAVGKEEDKQFFAGTGSPFTGVIGVATTNVTTMEVTKTAFSDVTWRHMVDLKMSVNPDIQNEGVYVVSKAVLQALLKDTDDNGRPIYSNDRPTPNRNLTGIDQASWDYNGSPLWVIGDGVLPTSAANKVAAIFGDFKGNSLFGVRQDMQMETFDQAYAGQDLSGKRQIALVVTERVALGFPDETAFGVLKTAGS